jgi:hypothetical protein
MRPELEELHAALKGPYRMDVAVPKLDPERLEMIKRVAHWPEAKPGTPESICIKLREALSGEVEDQPDDDPEAAPDDGE